MAGVRSFVDGLARHSLLLDLGCGNGRNLCINPEAIDVGSDYSMPLCEIAAQCGCPIFCASALRIPVRDSVFDHVICVAVIHHLATAARRADCLREVARILRVGGTAFVTDWATDQHKGKYKETDQMVPWTIDKRFSEDNATPTLHRFYHLFAKGEFAELARDIAELQLAEETFEADNWNALFRRV